MEISDLPDKQLKITIRNKDTYQNQKNMPE